MFTRIHKEVKSARGPNVDPTDRPGAVSTVLDPHQKKGSLALEKNKLYRELLVNQGRKWKWAKYVLKENVYRISRDPSIKAFVVSRMNEIFI